MTTTTMTGLQGGSRRASCRRLQVCLLLSAAVLLAALLLTDLPFDVSSQSATDTTFEVDLRTPERVAQDTIPEMPASADVAADMVDQEPAVEEPVAEAAEKQHETATSDTPDSARPVVDRHAEMRKAVTAAEDVNAKEQRFMGDFDEKLEAAMARYYAAPEHGPRPIWENVETDPLGRTLLWHGECYRVLADPNVMNLYVFETFTQHLVFCQAPNDVGQELPWVKEVLARYPHLRKPGA